MTGSNNRVPTKTTPRLFEPGAAATSPVLVWVFPRMGPWSRPGAAPQRIGRGDDCDTCLPGETISWHHAELRAIGGVLHVRDLGSRNGTRVNGRTVVEMSTLRCGDVLRCGEWVGCVVADRGLPFTFGEIAPGLFGGSTLAAALQAARRLSPEGFPMALDGPTGVGKERVAAAIHRWSGRAGAFVGVNCAAIPATLAEAELFGHTKGAFSGADRARPGYLRQADGGTLLLDEFAELPQVIQAKLLRALESREVRPVGDTVNHPIDVLLLTAAQEPLDTLVERGQLREDLAARLSDLAVSLPALARRREDIAPLFMHFLAQRIGGAAPEVDPDLIEWLCLGGWRRNVRGLERLARTMAALHGDEAVLSLKHVPVHDRRREPDRGVDAGAEDPRVLFQRIVRALEEHRGNVSRAAEALGIDRNKVRRTLKEHPDFDPKALRGPKG